MTIFNLINLVNPQHLLIAFFSMHWRTVNGQNLVNNPSAETNDLDGWTDSGTTIDTGWVTGGGSCGSGNYAFLTQASPSASATMSQLISVLSSVTYSVSLCAQCISAGEPTQCTVSTLSLIIGDTTVIDITNVAQNWMQYTGSYTASNTGEALLITGSKNQDNDGYALYVDEISVTFASSPNPTFYPTSLPSNEPSSRPSSGPTSQPSESPSKQPTGKPTAQPSSQPTDQPSEKPSGKPTGQPSGQPTQQPSGEPTAQPSSQPTDQPSTQPTAQPTAQPIAYPSSEPTSHPTSSPTQPRVEVINNNIASSSALQAITTIASLLAAMIGYKIPFWILNNWGHKFKLIHNEHFSGLKDNEIGLRIDGKNLQALHKAKIYNIPINNGNNNGVSQGLYDLIQDELEKPSQEFLLLESEKNQLRKFLFSDERINPKWWDFFNINGYTKPKYITPDTFVFIRSYTELGNIKGCIYYHCFSFFKYLHFLSYQNEIRLSDSVVNIQNADAEVGNPVNKAHDSESSKQDDGHLSIEGTKTESVAKISCVVCAIPDVHYATPLLNHPQSSEIFKYAREIGGTQAVNTLLEYKGYMSNDINEIKGAIKEIFADRAPTATPTAPSSTAGNIPSPASNNNLIISLLTAQQVVEYIPIINYIAQSFNITLPEVLDNKPILITSHLVLGNAAAALLPYESMATGMITSAISTSSYAIRLMTAGYLAEQRQETLAQDKPMSNFETLKYCGASMLAYTLPNLAKCAVTKWFIPEAECSFTVYDLSISASLTGADCYAVYKATSEPSIPTTADIVVPYMLDAIAFVITSQYVSMDMSNAAMAMQSAKQYMSVVSTVVAVDYVGRVAIDMAPGEVKEKYVEPALDYLEEVYICGMSNFNQLSSLVFSHFNQNIEL